MALTQLGGMARLLIVDDLPAVHDLLGAVVGPAGYDMVFCQSGDEALKTYREEAFEVCLLDVSMDAMDGFSLLASLRSMDEHCVAVMMTGFASTETAVEALRGGAFDFIRKPFKVDDLLAILERAVAERKRRLEQAEHIAGASAGQRPAPVPLEDVWPGTSAASERLRGQLTRLVGSSTPVLLEGERGAGHREVAHFVHRASRPEGSAFVGVDCGKARSEVLRERFLKPDGAVGDIFGEVGSGTLYLGNTDALDLELQDVLASALEVAPGDFRLVCSVGAALEDDLAAGRFSETLYYRVATLPISLPPLRERLDDIPALARHFLDRVAHATFSPHQLSFTEEALSKLASYSWPGNLSEFGGAVLSAGTGTETAEIGPEALPDFVVSGGQLPTLDDYLADRKAAWERMATRLEEG